MAAVGVGAALLFSGTQAVFATAPNPHLGNLVAAVSGLTWALTLTGLRWMGKDQSADSGVATVVVGNVIAFLVCLPMALPVARVTPADAAVILYLGIFQIGLAYLFLTRSLRHVSGFAASTLLLAEPVFNPVWSWLVHGERPGPAALVGGALILAAALAGRVS